MKLFDDIIKDSPGVKSGHVSTALGNESYRFGRNRSQPTRQNRRATAAENRRREGDDKETASLSAVASAKFPNHGLEDEEEDGDIVRASKSFYEIAYAEVKTDRNGKTIVGDSGNSVRKSWNLPLKIMKFVPDEQLIFGWASVVEKDGKAIIDKQGDVIPVKELENAAYEFTLNSRNGGDMHRRPNLAKLVESMVFTKDKQQALGIDIGQVGWWVGFKVHDEELWSSHKRGERPEFSIGGAAIPVEIEE